MNPENTLRKLKMFENNKRIFKGLFALPTRIRFKWFCIPKL